jgi:hypothetical protein
MLTQLRKCLGERPIGLLDITSLSLDQMKDYATTHKQTHIPTTRKLLLNTPHGVGTNMD